MLRNAVNRFITLHTHRIHNLPVIVMMPHSRCNCRCVMCDIWKANHDKKELSVETIAQHVKTFEKLGVREVVFSGGEALLHSNLWNLCELLKKKNIRLTLLSTGLLVGRHAQEIVDHLDGLIISLDGSERVHDAIRRIPDGFKKIADGIRSVKALKKEFPITARCVLQKQNFHDFYATVHAAKSIGLDQISFLAADVSSGAFNRHEPWDEAHVSDVTLGKADVEEFQAIINASFLDLGDMYAARFIAESPDKMMRLVQYYKAIHGMGDFPKAICNAPWVSAVIESDGNVQPCFFHKPYGNIYSADLESILNSQSAINFRKNLDMDSDEQCTKCVCSLKIGWSDRL